LLTRDFVAEKIQGAHLVIFVSPQIKKSWIKISGIDNDHTTVISNTTRESEAERVTKIPIRTLREELGLRVDDFIVVCVGKVDPAKSQDLLIEALPDMLEAKPSLHVVFVGRITPAGYEIIDKAEKLGVSQNCSFVGSHNSAYPYIRTADMLIHPSRAEGQGMVILEAMILGTPVLASRVGGIPFCIEHGKSGWLVPSDDSEALLSGFRKLATNSSLRNHLVRKARNRYWKMFSRERHISMIYKSISKVLS
jgi:glycosyltransferase involved in cell wall biosynthesis